MAAVVIDSGKKALLDRLTGAGTTTLANCRYHLFVSNVVPNHADTLGTYTEASYTGYANQVAGGWAASNLDSTFHATSNGSNLTWANSSGGPVSLYGYYVTDNANAVLLFAERFAGAPVTISVGFALVLTPNVTDTSEF